MLHHTPLLMARGAGRLCFTGIEPWSNGHKDNYNGRFYLSPSHGVYSGGIRGKLLKGDRSQVSNMLDVIYIWKIGTSEAGWFP